MKELYVTSREKWRGWLERNHDKSEGVWLVFYKKATGKPSLEYDAAVEEALCFGWIDSIIKSIDDERYKRKLTPRKPASRWSTLNKKRVTKLIRQFAASYLMKQRVFKPLPVDTLSPQQRTRFSALKSICE